MIINGMDYIIQTEHKLLSINDSEEEVKNDLTKVEIFAVTKLVTNLK